MHPDFLKVMKHYSPATTQSIDANKPKKTSRQKINRIFRIAYYVALYSLSGFALFIISLTLAVKFKWTNQNGTVDLNNRYFNDMAGKYEEKQGIVSKNVNEDESLFFQKLGLLAEFRPVDTKKIHEAYSRNKDLEIASRMFDATVLLLSDNKDFQKRLAEIDKTTNSQDISVFEWSNYEVWKQFTAAAMKDRVAIDSASRITGVESRLIVMCLVGEQVRMFNSKREKFKQYVYPFSRVMLANRLGFGVTAIQARTAHEIEANLFNENSPFYPGDYFKKCLNTRDSYEHLKIDTIAAHESLTIQRLIKGGDHFYSYLYTGFLLRQYYQQWINAGYDISKRPEVLGTLFNIGFRRSIPKKDPKAGGSSFVVGEKEYSFGGLCYEFYYSGEMQDAFPLTSTPFISIGDLERVNSSYVEYIEQAISDTTRVKFKDSTILKIDSVSTTASNQTNIIQN